MTAADVNVPELVVRAHWLVFIDHHRARHRGLPARDRRMALPPLQGPRGRGMADWGWAVSGRWRVERCRNHPEPTWAAYQRPEGEGGAWVSMSQHFGTWREAMDYADREARR